MTTPKTNTAMTLDQFRAAPAKGALVVTPSTSIEVRAFTVKSDDASDVLADKLRAIGAPDEEIDAAVRSFTEYPDAGDSVAAFKLSSARVDSYKDTIDVDGWDVADFKANPVVLFAHNSQSPPIGRDIARWSDGDFLRGVVRFASREISPFADMIARMVRAGFLSATSVGFEPIEWKETDDPERVGPWGFPALDFTKQKLREWSVVPVPANPDATAEMRSRLGLGHDHVRALVEWAEMTLDGSSTALVVPRDVVEKARAAVVAKTSALVKRAGDDATTPDAAMTDEDEDDKENEEIDDDKAEATATCPACGYEGPASSFTVTEPEAVDDMSDEDEGEGEDEGEEIDEEKIAALIAERVTARFIARDTIVDAGGGLVADEDESEDQDLAARVAEMVERRFIDAWATKTGRLPF